jgi:hypothetical protein
LADVPATFAVVVAPGFGRETAPDEAKGWNATMAEAHAAAREVTAAVREIRRPRREERTPEGEEEVLRGTACSFVR